MEMIIADNQYPSKHQLLRLLFLHRGGSYILHRYRHLFGPIAPLYVSVINIELVLALHMVRLWGLMVACSSNFVILSTTCRGD